MKTKEEYIAEAYLRYVHCPAVRLDDGSITITCQLLLDSQEKAKRLESDLTALRSLVRRMREVGSDMESQMLAGDWISNGRLRWDALCAEADKALDPHGSEGGGA